MLRHGRQHILVMPSRGRKKRCVCACDSEARSCKTRQPGSAAGSGADAETEPFLLSREPVRTARCELSWYPTERRLDAGQSLLRRGRRPKRQNQPITSTARLPPSGFSGGSLPAFLLARGAGSTTPVRWCRPSPDEGSELSASGLGVGIKQLRGHEHFSAVF